MRVFDHIVQQRGAKRGDVQPQIRQDVRHFQGMRKVGFAGLAHLRLCCSAAKSNARRSNSTSSSGRFWRTLPAERQSAPAGRGRPASACSPHQPGRRAGLSDSRHRRIVGPTGTGSATRPTGTRCMRCRGDLRLRSLADEKQRRPEECSGRREFRSRRSVRTSLQLPRPASA